MCCISEGFLAVVVGGLRNFPEPRRFSDACPDGKEERTALSTHRCENSTASCCENSTASKNVLCCGNRTASFQKRRCGRYLRAAKLNPAARQCRGRHEPSFRNFNCPNLQNPSREPQGRRGSTRAFAAPGGRERRSRSKLVQIWHFFRS